MMQSPLGGKGSVIASSWVPRDERCVHIEVACAECGSRVFVQKEEVMTRDKVVISRTPWPDYMFPGWDVICPKCHHRHVQEQLVEMERRRAAELLL